MGDSFFSTRPVIGISGSNADSASVRAMITEIASSGATPIFLGNHARRNPDADIEKIDALVVMGNNYDLDPSSYGQINQGKTNSEMTTPESRARAEYEYAILGKALQSGMPVLGVCAGMQRLNVLCGGDLHQHVPDLIGSDYHDQRLHNIAPFIPVQTIHLAPDSTLGQIASQRSLFTPQHNGYTYHENSMHHQAVHRVGTGLRPSAYSEDMLPDGSHLIEAIEADPNGCFNGQFVLGVQWHPEFCASELSAKVASRITQEAQNFAVFHGRSHAPSQAQRENILSALDRAPAAGGMAQYIQQQRGDTNRISAVAGGR